MIYQKMASVKLELHSVKQKLFIVETVVKKAIF
jgi:hypothetical protein